MVFKGPAALRAVEVSRTFCYHSAYWKVLRYLQFLPQESDNPEGNGRRWNKFAGAKS
jgi:hypothetical protein